MNYNEDARSKENPLLDFRLKKKTLRLVEKAKLRVLFPCHRNSKYHNFG